MNVTFKGGFHPEDNKSLTSQKPIVNFNAPDIVVIPLSQHIGAVCNPTVKVGDSVKVGDLIGDSEAFMSVPVHSSVSGIVKALENRPHPNMGECLSVVIENDNNYEVSESVKPIDIDSLSKEEILDHIRKSGIVGMGGATFPTHVKLNIPKDKKIDTVIVNGAECEPFLTADHRIMLEKSEEIIKGLEIVLKLLEVKNGIIVTEDNKKDAVSVLEKASCSNDNIKVVTAKTKYPQGSEKQIIDAVLKRKVKSGKLPMDVGVVVLNVATVKELYTYFKTGLPLIGRVVTVSGSGVKNPCNLYVRIGTPYQAVIEYAGMNEGVKKVISGGPMMGFSQYSLDVPVMKGTSGILLFTEKEDEEYEEKACIRCGRCVERCPMGLMPFMISEFARLNDFESAIKYNIRDCIECGVCSYICPQRRYLVQSIRTAKAKLPKK